MPFLRRFEVVDDNEPGLTTLCSANSFLYNTVQYLFSDILVSVQIQLQESARSLPDMKVEMMMTLAQRMSLQRACPSWEVAAYWPRLS